MVRELSCKRGKVKLEHSVHFLQQLPDSCPLQVTGLGSKETDYLVLWPNNFHVESLEDIAIGLCSAPQKTQPANCLQAEKASGNWTRKASERAHGSASRSGSQRAPIAVPHSAGSSMAPRPRAGSSRSPLDPGAGPAEGTGLPRALLGTSRRTVGQGRRPSPRVPCARRDGVCPRRAPGPCGGDGGRVSPHSPPQPRRFPQRQHLLPLHSQGSKNNPAFELFALVPSPSQRIISCF